MSVFAVRLLREVAAGILLCRDRLQMIGVPTAGILVNNGPSPNALQQQHRAQPHITGIIYALMQTAGMAAHDSRSVPLVRVSNIIHILPRARHRVRDLPHLRGSRRQQPQPLLECRAVPVVAHSLRGLADLRLLVRDRRRSQSTGLAGRRLAADRLPLGLQSPALGVLASLTARSYGAR